MYTLQFDGLFRPAQGTNPAEQAGFMCYGWLIWKDHKVVARGHGGVARSQAATSNTAEYMALIEGLDALRDMAGVCEQPVTVIGDARSVIDQMQQVSEILSADTRLLNQRAREISDHFVQIEWTWTPREKNRAADALTRRAMRQIRWDAKNYQAAVELFDRPERSKRSLSLVDLRVYQPVQAD